MIPTYNEEGNVRPIYEAIRNEFYSNLPDYDYEILFIDNKSTDNTRAILTEICSEDKGVKAIFNCKNFGQFSSPYYGMMQTSGDCTIFMCADFQDPVDLIPQMVHEWENGHKVICMIKTTSKEKKLMYLIRSIYYKLIRMMSDVPQIEHFTGFGLYDRSFMDIIRAIRDPTPFLRGVVAEYAPDHLVIPYEQQLRKKGKSHNNFFSLYDAAMLSFTSYTKYGLRIATFTGFFISAISFLIGLVFLLAKLINWDGFTAGYAPTMISVFFMGGVQLAFMGFLGEYIMAMNTRIMNRPLVIEEERLNFDEKPSEAKQQTPSPV